jgi:hypothetical protein
MGRPRLELDNLLSTWPVYNSVYLHLGQGLLLFLELPFGLALDFPFPDRDSCTQLLYAVCPDFPKVVSEDIAFPVS